MYPKKMTEITITVDASKFAPDLLFLTVGVYPNNDFKTNTVSSKNLEEHIKYNLLYRPGRALFGLMYDGQVIMMNQGGLSDAQVADWTERISKMKPQDHDTAPYI